MMFRKEICITIMLLMFAIMVSSCVTANKFKGRSLQPGKEVMLKGTLYKPDDKGPHPAIVVLHGCAGITDRAYMWASRLKKWGYVAFVVDSLGPRGAYSNCEKNSVPVVQRTLDAYSAKAYLSELPFVNRDKIGVIGFSEGGTTILSTVNPRLSEDYLKVEKDSLFKAAVALYPSCNLDLDVNTNLMILIGEADDWTFAGNCSKMVDNIKKGKHEIILKTYPGAHHCFDWEGLDTTSHGHTIRYNHTAASDAKIRVKDFFAKHLK